jgi:hypothetical protein
MAMTATTTSSAQPDPRKKVATFRPRLDFPIECVAANAAAVCKNAMETIDTTVNSPYIHHKILHQISLAKRASMLSETYWLAGGFYNAGVCSNNVKESEATYMNINLNRECLKVISQF